MCGYYRDQIGQHKGVPLTDADIEPLWMHWNGRSFPSLVRVMRTVNARFSSDPIVAICFKLTGCDIGSLSKDNLSLVAVGNKTRGDILMLDDIGDTQRGLSKNIVRIGWKLATSTGGCMNGPIERTFDEIPHKGI